MKLDAPLGRVFTWLARTGMARRFGSVPIGWYQIHACHAIDVLAETFGPHAELRVRHGVVMSPDNPAVITTSEVFRKADERSRQ